MLTAAVYFVLLFFLVFSFLALVASSSIAWALIITKGVPFISTPRSDWLKICEAAELKPGQVVYDLGCGKANLLITAAKNFGIKGVGYEIALWPNVWGWLRIWWHRANVEIRMKNFLKADLGNADVVFCYLFPHVMDQLEAKFKKELKPGAKVVSYAFPMSNINPTKVVKSTQKYSFFTKKPIHTSNIYIYQF
jgi:hypothetical protein